MQPAMVVLKYDLQFLPENPLLDEKISEISITKAEL